MIPNLSSSTQRVPRRIALVLATVAVAALAAPTVYLVSGGHAQAGDRPDASIATDKLAPQPEFLPPLAASEERILAALEEPTELELQETSLSDTADFIKRKHRIEVQIDQKALSDLDLDAATTHITNSFKGITLKSALKLLLKPFDLTFVVDNEVLLFTSKTEAEARIVTRTYPVGDLLDGQDADAYEALVEAITGTIEPNTWSEKEKGAPGAIKVVKGSRSVVITHNHEMHDKVLTLLRSLRKARGFPVPDRAPAQPTPKPAPAATPAPAKAPNNAAPAKPANEDPFG